MPENKKQRKIKMKPENVLSLIQSRWSPRKFADRPVTDAQLFHLFEAARWAPSSYNEQPWIFILGRKGHASYQKLLSLLVPGNASWAKTAPVLVLTAAKQSFHHNGKPNRHAFHDVGMALENLMLAARGEGLFTHPMGGFYLEKARDALHLPEGVEPVAMVALGYLAEGEEAGKRARQELSEFVFEGTWGQTPHFLNK